MDHVNVFNFLLRVDETTTNTATKIISITEWSGRIPRNIYLEPFMYGELKYVKYTMMKLVLRKNPFDAFIQIGFESRLSRSAEVRLPLAVAFLFFASKIVTNHSDTRHRDASYLCCDFNRESVWFKCHCIVQHTVSGWCQWHASDLLGMCSTKWFQWMLW